MDEAKINQLKYPELLTYAKELGINNYGKYTGKPTKEIIMEKIKEHFDILEQQQRQQQVTAKFNANKTPKKATEVLRTVRLSPPEQPQPRQSKRQNGATTATTTTTPSKLIKKKVEQQLHQALDNESSKDDKKEEEVEEEASKVAKKTKKSSKKREENVTEESESSGKKVKKTKKVEAKATIKEEEAATTMPEKVSRRKHAVVTYKEIDAKTKLRNDTEVKHKSKKASTKDKSDDCNDGAVAATQATTSVNCVDTDKEKVTRKEGKTHRKRAAIAENPNDADVDKDKDLEEKSKLLYAAFFFP
jgi:hypothetical protein